MASIEVQVGTSRTSVPGRIAVVDLPPEESWASSGDPAPSELPAYAVVGQTAQGWPVPLDGR